MLVSATAGVHDQRVPPIVLMPQFVGLVAFSGNPAERRVLFIVIVVVNVFIALAGRMTADLAIVPRWVSEWARPVAAIVYAGLLLAIMPLVVPALTATFATAVGVCLATAAVAYVLPGVSTPAGVEHQMLRASGALAVHEEVAFYTHRIGLVAAYAAVPAATVHVLLGDGLALAALASRLALLTIARATSPPDRANLH